LATGQKGEKISMDLLPTVDGFVIEIIKPNAADLNDQEVTTYKNKKGFWWLIAQVRCDSNTKVHFVQTELELQMT
jgi:hypothetical protein